MASILKTLPLATGATRAWLKSMAVKVFVLPELGTDLLLLWEKRMAQRHALRNMDTHLLDDIGITPEDAVRESDKPFWRA